MSFFTELNLVHEKKKLADHKSEITISQGDPSHKVTHLFLYLLEGASHRWDQNYIARSNEYNQNIAPLIYNGKNLM